MVEQQNSEQKLPSLRESGQLGTKLAQDLRTERVFLVKCLHEVHATDSAATDGDVGACLGFRDRRVEEEEEVAVKVNCWP